MAAARKKHKQKKSAPEQTRRRLKWPDALRGWRVPVAFAAGLVTSLSFVVLFWPVFTWFGLAPLLVAAYGRGPRGAAWLAFLWGLGFTLPGLYWFTTVTFAGWIGIALYCGAFTAVFGAFVGWVDVRLPRWRFVAAPVAWVTLEWVRAWFLSGFPWLYVAHAQISVPLLTQVADLGGVWPISFAIVLLNAALAELVLTWARGHWDLPQPRARRLSTGAAVGLLAAMVAYGIWALSAYAAPDANDAGTAKSRALNVLMIQGNIDTPSRARARTREEKRQREQRAWDLHCRLTDRVASRTPDLDLVLWPETMVPGIINHQRVTRNWLRGWSDKYRTPMLVGADWEDRNDQDEMLAAFNTAVLFKPRGEGLPHYHKRHLVPFGEFVPGFLRGIVRPVTTEGYTHGALRQDLLEVLDLKLSTTICYEDAFPELTQVDIRRGAQLMVNLTNDAWYAGTAQLRQHVALSRFRCIEARRPMLRCTNSGVSGVIDANGRLLISLPMEQPTTDVVTVVVPSYALGGFVSPYMRAGNWFAWLCLAAMAGTALWLAGTRLRRGGTAAETEDAPAAQAGTKP